MAIASITDGGKEMIALSCAMHDVRFKSVYVCMFRKYRP